MAADKPKKAREQAPLAKPGVDPYEIQWPDDAKELRAAERAKELKRSEVVPASLWLTALIIGIAVVYLFVAIVTAVGGALGFFVVAAAPIALAGVVLAFPVALLLERASRGWRRGLPELAFVLVGLIIGGSWTYALVTYLRSENQPDQAIFEGIRVYYTIFMAVAVATAFLCAKMLAPKVRNYPRPVQVTAVTIIVLILLSIYSNFFVTPEL